MGLNVQSVPLLSLWLCSTELLQSAFDKLLHIFCMRTRFENKVTRVGHRINVALLFSSPA
jgi:hypothetical protein